MRVLDATIHYEVFLRQMDSEGLCRALVNRGVPAEVRADGAVFVPELGEVDPRSAADPKKVANRWIAAETRKVLGSLGYRVDATIARVPDVTTERKQGFIEVSVLGKPVARVDRFSVKGPDGTIVASGNLLVDDVPLAILQATLRSAVGGAGHPDPRGARADSEGFLMTSWPGDPGSELARMAMDASRRLRSERSIVPASRIDLRTTRGRIMFERLVEGQNPLELEFTFKQKRRRLTGALRLATPNDPLALRVVDDPDEGLCMTAWAVALVAYSKLCCVESPRVSNRRKARSKRPQVGQGSTGESRATSGGASGQQRASNVTEVATLDQAADLIRSSVRGHRRRLNLGEQRSVEAEKNARAVGISLPNGYTWVRPHSRGDTLIRIGAGRPVSLW